MNQDPLYQARKSRFIELTMIAALEEEPTQYGEPCGQPAGSLEKIEVLRQRYALGQVLHHPSDDKTVLLQQNRPRQRTAC